MAEPTPDTHSEPAKAAAPHAAHGHVSHGHDHGHSKYPHLAHHFDSPQQQFDAGKLGIWLFLLTEVLFFSGLFCAYTIYRAMRPEVFVYAHYFLDTRLGALNTCVLLLSSLTAAWAVRNAQLAETKKLVLNITITIVCACTFMVVKYFEYSHKYHDGLLPGKNFTPHEQVWEVHSFRHKHPEAAAYAERLIKQSEAAAKPQAGADAAKAPVAVGAAAPAAAPPPVVVVPPKPEEIGPLLQAGVLGPKAETPDVPSRPRNAHVFFSIYFFMTGLHGFHVLAGIGVFVWLLIRAKKGVFGPDYFGPIDYAALYWHLVDLIWIYLFPLLYLIH
jgi:cytochrome c oxidase subunit III